MRLKSKFTYWASSICLFLFGCESSPTPKTPEELYYDYASGVVLILCEYYYSLTLPTGITLYTTGISESGEPENITMSEAVIKQNSNKQTGTGFFIDSKGNIMTNRHVVDVSLDDADVRERIVKSMQEERQTYIDSMEMARQAYANLQEQEKQCYSYDYFGNAYADNEKLRQIREAMAYVEEKYDSWVQICDFFSANSNPNAIKIKVYSKIGIAYNNTLVTTLDDFLERTPCNIHKISRQKNVDLAIIQLRSKSTPESVHVFDVTGIAHDKNDSNSFGRLIEEFLFGEDAVKEKDNEDLKIGQQLYMIGYNHGIQLAQTRTGIKAQMTSGKITQLPDDERLLYSIPTMQGSSGSPVIDEKGVLRGVNFAKATLNDDFNFGIPMNLITNFLKE